MSDLLDRAVQAHGGIDRWNQIRSIRVAASITGAIWFVKGQGDVLKDVVLTAETRTERLTIDFPGQDKRAVFEPSRVVIEQADGTTIEVRDDPEQSFAGHERETACDEIHVAYFFGEALWTYLNTPFLYTQNGFVTEEIAPIVVGGETWRRLRVTFPGTSRVTRDLKSPALVLTGFFAAMITQWTFLAVPLGLITLLSTGQLREL